MKKNIMSLCCLLSLCYFATAQTETKLKSGQTIIIKTDGSWSDKSVTYPAQGEEVKLSNGKIIIVMPNNTWKAKPSLPTGEEEITLSSGEVIIVNTNKTWKKKPFSFDYETIYIAGGTFQMGSNESDAESDPKPVHSVTVSSFYMGKYEVTQAQWKAVMGSNPSELGCDQCPVDMVNWNDVQVFIQKLNARTGKKYRLPTEAEWEYAARGAQSYKYAGSDNIYQVAIWTKNNPAFGDYNSKYTAPVGSKLPNGYGIYDMSGNIQEWCSDWYGPYNYNAETNPTGPATGSKRVMRGGSWYDWEHHCLVYERGQCAPDYKYYWNGFRLLRTE
jgi:formylglycine-generating enzyme required for sulfatase activity